MHTPRTPLKIDENTPGTEIAAETAAAMAASSIVFRRVDRKYARRLLNKAKLVIKQLIDMHELRVIKSYIYIYIFITYF